MLPVALQELNALVRRLLRAFLGALRHAAGDADAGAGHRDRSDAARPKRRAALSVRAEGKARPLSSGRTRARAARVKVATADTRGFFVLKNRQARLRHDTLGSLFAR